MVQASPESILTWPEGPLRTLVDANVFARRDWMRAVHVAADEGWIEPFWSPAIIAEVVRFLTWLWIRRNGGEVSDWARRAHSAEAHQWFDSMTALFRVVEDRPPLEPAWSDVPRDPHDAPIWTAAVRAKVALVVTDNLRDGPPLGADGLRSWQGIVYIAPDDFIAFVDVWRAAQGEPGRSERDAEPATSIADAGQQDLAALPPRVLALLRAVEARPRAPHDPPRPSD